MKNINNSVLGWAVFLTFALAYVVPCCQLEDWRKAFGFPFGWFTVYHDTIGRQIVTSTSINILPLAADIIILYAVISFIAKCTQRQKRSKTDSKEETN